MIAALLGDSHFARMKRASIALNFTVHNVAVGGITAAEVLDQIASLSSAPDVVFLSIGTNDAARHNQVSLSEFERNLSRIFTVLRGHRVVFVASPGVVEDRPAGQLWTAEEIASYRDAAQRICASEGVEFLALHRLLEPLGDAAFDADGLHLSGAGYGVLVDALNSAVE